ncbi:MAG: hypothetical protein Fur0010_11290 [Bdellovibrio sp.]
MSSNPLILGIDIEGVGLDLSITGSPDHRVDRVMEIGAVLWDWEFQQPARLLSELINEADRMNVSEDLEQLTGLNDKILDRWGKKGAEIKTVLERLSELVHQADYLMAHNGNHYDRPMLEEMFKRYNMKFPEKTWIDSMVDIEYPPKIPQRSLAMLEYSHGFINPFPHRALTDVLSMLKIASQYPIDRIISLAKSPMVRVVANLKAPQWSDRAQVDAFNKVKHKVARSKFKWNPDNKTWYKDVHKVLLDEGKYHFDFEWTIEKIEK